ncbi:MAG: acyl-CoA dehydrogenase family protein [Deltaproteobacteria bacterium]|nr:acyl-CoA dehydrogenase family protein [Deltaproteobacteria bacterium]
MAEFTLDEDQQQIQDMMRKFAQNELREVARDCDEEAELPSDLLDKVWELGFTHNAIEEKYGGYELGRSAVTAAITVEELAWGDVSLAIGALSPLTMMIPILEFGTEEQKEEWLPHFCGEKFFPATSALMEPRITFDPTLLQTTVEMGTETLVLNGTKCMVPLADQAEHILVFATTAKGAGPASVEAVIVDKDTPGLSIGEREKNMGLRPLPLFPVTFKDCEVPRSRRVGGDRGLDYMRLLNLSRANLCAMAVGVARASHEYALNYAKERYAFGEPIASRQTIAFMLAESAMEVDGMRLLAWRAAWRLDRHEDATRDATLAKMYCAEQAMKVVDYGVQILGGHGYIREHPVEMWFRNGRAFATMEGLATG